MNAMAQEDIAAALQLCSWKHLDLDPQTAHELEEDRRYHKQRLQQPLPPLNHRDEQTMQYVPPTMNDKFPSVLRGLVGEYCSPSWEKKLTESDLLDTQTRLLLKRSYVKKDLFPLLSTRQADKLKNGGFVVNVYDRRGNIYEMEFKLWGIKAYVLTNHNWILFARHHNLVKDEDWITLWMFKHVDTHQICFAIISEKRPLATVPAAAGEKRKKVGRMVT
ncbi:hypothetical protein POM88_036625 [Heracleum sosnowskyi]|uniref:TF-B3 domain-containing protein n=1 Tax=Heracleum sosnowskyi TaxID=360622 RepID=A0AAD8MFV5_9APIA|nr:hypothetical protein POM88_036625 [Heracleum sosnowskyi]